MASLNKGRMLMGSTFLPFVVYVVLHDGALAGGLTVGVFGLGVYLMKFNPFVPGRIKNERVRIAVLLLGATASAITAIADAIKLFHH